MILIPLQSYHSFIHNHRDLAKLSYIRIRASHEDITELPDTRTIESITIPNSLIDYDRKITWKAAVKSSTKTKEINRSVEDYIKLPASQYSVLSAQQIERLSDTSFKCVLGNMNFFGNIICPILYVDVNVYPDQLKSEIVVVRAETTGSEIADKLSGTFNVSASNVISVGVDKKFNKVLCSEVNLNIDVIVPKSKIPLNVIQTSGNFLIQSSLSVIVAAFIRILAADFKRWSAGDNERNAVEGATLV